jgi:hypothetical protein
MQELEFKEEVVVEGDEKNEDIKKFSSYMHCHAHSLAHSINFSLMFFHFHFQLPTGCY